MRNARNLAIACLKAASDVFGNHGCNDVFLKEGDDGVYGQPIPAMSPEERKELLLAMERWNGDQAELARLEALPVGDSEFDYTSDFFLMSYLAARLEGKA